MSRATRKATTRSAGKRRSITDLTKEFKAARAAASAITTNSPAKQAKFDRAAARLGHLAAQIAKAPASGVAEMLLKIEAVTMEGEDAEYDCLVSLRSDLTRLQRDQQRLTKGLEHVFGHLL
jgi:hypothetical protein